MIFHYHALKYQVAIMAAKVKQLKNAFMNQTLDTVLWFL